jgi:hypothetical protein
MAGRVAGLAVAPGGVKRLGRMRWHRGWRSFYLFLGGVKKRRFVAEGYLMNDRVAVAKVET